MCPRVQIGKGNGSKIHRSSELTSSILVGGIIIIEQNLDIEHMPSWKWHRYRVYTAAKRYRQECGWDFSPGPAGIWILAFDALKVAGFLILHDRDGDGLYETASHIWTDPARRRQGVGQSLLKYARDHYPITTLEGPYTEQGFALLKRVVPDLLSM